MGVSVAVAVLMIIVAWSVNKKPNFAENKGLAKVLENKWYVDELYEAIVLKPIAALSDILDKYVEKRGIDGVVNGVGKTVRWGGDRLRLLQTGQVGFYIFIMVIGIVLLFLISIFGVKL
jgi:NADH-quinone oxidoreductase subunit L